MGCWYWLGENCVCGVTDVVLPLFFLRDLCLNAPAVAAGAHHWQHAQHHILSHVLNYMHSPQQTLATACTQYVARQPGATSMRQPQAHTNAAARCQTTCILQSTSLINKKVTAYTPSRSCVHNALSIAALPCRARLRRHTLYSCSGVDSQVALALLLCPVLLGAGNGLFDALADTVL